MSHCSPRGNGLIGQNSKEFAGDAASNVCFATCTTRPSRRELLASLGLLGAASVGLDSRAQPPADAAPKSDPRLSPAARKVAADQLLAYFKTTAPQLLRPAEGILKYPSIAPSLPGKQYATSLWDWDTLWTARGLFRYAALTKDPGFKEKVVEHVIGSFQNFFDHQSEDGRIPVVIDIRQADPLGSLRKASPNINNQAKPVFAQLALLIAEQHGSVDWLSPYFDKLLRFHDSWVSGNQSAVGLLVWGDDVAIGNDNDPTTFGRPFFSSANLLLNCLFLEDLKAAGELALRLNRGEDGKRLLERARQLEARIQQLCWDPRDSFFYTLDVQCVDRRRELIPNVKPGMDMSWHSLPMRIQTFTGFLPIWSKAATPGQATKLVQANYVQDERFRGWYGVRSLSSLESMYSMDFSSNPSNWLGPVWIIVNYLVWKGLTNYNFHHEADQLRDKTLLLLSADLMKNGSLNEYYHPDTGAALSHKGFMDWNLLVLEMI